MTFPLTSSQERLLQDEINAIWPNAYDQLEKIASLDHGVACQIASVILRFACRAQHAGSIVAGRNAFKRLPADWLSAHLSSLTIRAINLNDAWEYRRFLELLSGENAKLLHTYVMTGLNSSDPEIREVASDFANQRDT